MNVRKRLQISNTLMVVVPVIFALLMGVVCLGAVWLWAAGGTLAGSEMLEESIKTTLAEQVGISDLKVLLVLAALAVIIVAIAVAVLANRFVTKFVIDNVTGPLDLLSTGVDRIREGNLEYRIAYTGNDEFRPVCDAFDEMAARLQESVNRDKETEEARKRLIAGFSHDIRSPLTCIKGYAEGLRDGVADSTEARERYVDVILGKTDEVQRMSSRMLELAKLDMEAYVTDLQPVNLKDYVVDFVERNAEQFTREGVKFELALEDAPVLADVAELDRIVSNIVENSVRYRTSEWSVVTVRTAQVADGCVLSLGDDGPGVSSTDLPRLFESLFRSDEARTRCGEGSGLGLAIVAASAKVMGATVRADVSPAGGLLVELLFSCNQSAVTVAAADGSSTGDRSGVNQAVGEQPGASRATGNQSKGRQLESKTVSTTAAAKNQARKGE